MRIERSAHDMTAAASTTGFLVPWQIFIRYPSDDPVLTWVTSGDDLCPKSSELIGGEKAENYQGDAGPHDNGLMSCHYLLPETKPVFVVRTPFKSAMMRC
jgi:hypothetical protein